MDYKPSMNRDISLQSILTYNAHIINEQEPIALSDIVSAAPMIQLPEVNALDANKQSFGPGEVVNSPAASAHSETKIQPT